MLCKRLCPSSPTWEKCAEVVGDVTTGDVNDLVEGNVYEFRVLAVNKGGVSEPSLPSDSHLARPKNGNIFKRSETKLTI